MGTATEIDFDARYAVEGYRGVAFWLKGHATKTVPVTFADIDDDGEAYEFHVHGEYEEEADPDWVIAVMVGDDREHLVEVADLTVLGDLDYCASCGQVGCSHDGRDR